MAQKFQYKTYRCEWVVELGEVDQYGLNFKAYESHPFPTREEAVEFRSTVAVEHKYVEGRWIPLAPGHGYREVHISYREVWVQKA